MDLQPRSQFEPTCFNFTQKHQKRADVIEKSESRRGKKTYLNVLKSNQIINRFRGKEHFLGKINACS
jgi:hypothetical protein